MAGNQQSAFKKAMEGILRAMRDPANRAPCVDCEGAGYLLTVSGKKASCPFCYGDGTVLVRDPLDGILGGCIGGKP